MNLIKCLKKPKTVIHRDFSIVYSQIQSFCNLINLWFRYTLVNEIFIIYLEKSSLSEFVGSTALEVTKMSSTGNTNFFKVVYLFQNTGFLFMLLFSR